MPSDPNWASTSGLTPASRFSVADHQLAALRASEGKPNGSRDDLLFLFYSRQSGLSGMKSRSDHEKKYKGVY